ncbi:MAG: hypothetical protein LBJ67_03690 [Planctomycetaceae bacterium]|jgi:hypothetical protein|nr:hypothetical protein [Planctomycetaceae bacterium]
MALDGYTLCPGGRNKKIRFCCPEKLKELDTITSFFSNNQQKACLAYIEELENKYKDKCACLTALKLWTLMGSGDWEKYQTVAEDFYAREPQNGTAIANLAIARAVKGRVTEAVSLLVDGFELTEEGKILDPVATSAQFIAEVFCEQISPVVGLAIAKLLPAFWQNSEDISVLLQRWISEAPLPPLLKGLRFNPYAPDDFPDKKEYDTIAPLVATGRWKTAKRKLEALAPQAEKWAGLLFSLAILQIWLGQISDGCETLRKYAEQPDLSEEEQAYALVIVYMIDRRNLRDEVKIVSWEVTISDFDRAQERLLSEPRLYSIDFDPRRYGTVDSPPPKNVFMVLNHSFAPDDIPPAIDNIPQQVGSAFLFGKQTDRDARILFTDVLDSNRDAINTMLIEALQETLGEIKEPSTLRETSLILAQIDARLRFKNSNPPTNEQIQQITYAHIGAGGIFQTWWLNQTFDELDGQTPLQAASDKKYKARLLGMIQTLELTMPTRLALESANALRKTLGFAELGEIVLPEKDAEIALSKIPSISWFRVDTKSLSNPVLAGEFAMLDLLSEERGSLHFANAVLERPLREIDPSIRGLALHTMILNAERHEDIDTALLWIDRAKNEAKELGRSLGEWEVEELLIHIKQNNQYESTRLINHIMTYYKNDPAVMASLQSIFIQMGILNPDGTPTAYARQQPRQPVDLSDLRRPTENIPPKPSLDNSLSGNPPKENSGGSKLWVPD